MPKVTPEEFFKKQEKALNKVNKLMENNPNTPFEYKADIPLCSKQLTDFEFMEVVLQSGVGVPDEVIDDLVEDPNNQYSGQSTLFEPYLTGTEKAIVETLLYRRRR